MKRFLILLTIAILAMPLIFVFSSLATSTVLGDFTGDELVTSDDAIYLLRHVLFPEDYSLNGAVGDFTGDSAVTSDDAIYLLRHVLFPDDYPLIPISSVYKMTWLNYDGTLLATTFADVGSAPTYNGSTPIKQNDSIYQFTFTGWSPSIEAARKDTTFVAQFSRTIRTIFTISYHANGGTNAPPPQTKTKGRAITLSSSVPQNGEHVFIEWACGNNGKTYSAGSSFAVDSDATLYAVWGHMCEACHGTGVVTNVYLCSNCHGSGYICSKCGSGNVVVTTTGYGTGYLCKSCGSISLDAKTCPSCGGTGDNPVTGTCSTCNGNLYIKDSTTTYTITLNDGITTIGNTTVLQSAPYKLTVPIKAGYEFLGWFDAEEGGNQYTNECGVSLATWNNTSGKTLYAHWRLLYYTITYDCDDCEAINDMPTAYTVEESAIELPTQERDYYSFHWEVNGQPVTRIDTTVAQNIVAKAVWESVFTYTGDTITGLTDDGKELTKIEIPRTIDGNIITSIADSAFMGCNNLKEIVIPDSIVSIGNGAFTNCNGLMCVNINNLGAWCRISFNDFYANPLYYAKRLYLNGELITDLIIPNSITSINDYAFRNCAEITSLTIPDSVTSIGNYAFYGCTELTSLTIPDSVAIICDYAFIDCKGLTNMTIGNGVTSIGVNAFYNCAKLTSVDIADLGAWCRISFNDSYANPLYYAKKLYLNGELITDLVVPDGITSIGSSAFSGCTGLTSVTIPDGVTNIGDYAFSGCTGLTSVTIPDGVTSIGNYAFRGCTELTSLTIPDSVAIIGDYAFYDCTELTSLTIPDSVAIIGDYAFHGCKGLTNVTIGNGVTSIGKYAFYYCTSLTSVKITDLEAWCKISFSYNASNPLYYAKKLYLNGELITDLVVPDGITSIGSDAFSYCAGLTSVTIPNGVTSMGSSAFAHCTGLTSVTIPGSISSINGSAFRGCTGLTVINFNGTKAQWGNINKGYYWDDNTGDYVIHCTNGDILKQ